MLSGRGWNLNQHYRPTQQKRAHDAVSGVPSDSLSLVRLPRSARRLALASEQSGILLLSLSSGEHGAGEAPGRGASVEEERAWLELGLGLGLGLGLAVRVSASKKSAPAMRTAAVLS
eukprot:scaffold21045_cov59-Phaeocystis_antarctica.AAC.12